MEHHYQYFRISKNGYQSTYALANSVICVVGGIRDNSKGDGCVVKVLTIVGQMAEIIFQKQFVLRQSLHWFQHEMLQFQVATTIAFLKVFDQFAELGVFSATVLKMVVDGGKFADVSRVQFEKGALFDDDIGDFRVT